MTFWLPQRGQWCEANISSVRSPHSSIISPMYFDHFSESRMSAPRMGTRLCMLWVQFSAVHNQPWSGKKKFISAGASASGVIWNTTRTPSTTSSVPVAQISSVGAIRPAGHSGIALPRPQSTCCLGPAGSSGPNWYIARRAMLYPAITFSPSVSRMKC